jgi:hypothetical protein
MNMPGFNAESSLGPTKGAYRSNTVFGKSAAVEIAQRTLLAPRRQSCTEKYGAYISHWFPVTVCESLYDDLTVSTFREARPAILGDLGGMAGSRATSLDPSLSQRTRLSGPQYCHVIHAPFIAEVTTIQSCNDSIPDFSVLEVMGRPELAIKWDGGISDIPQPYNPHWFSFEGVSCNCCPGFTDCLDGRCLPKGVSCDTQPA